jgi:hypothetical protein
MERVFRNALAKVIAALPPNIAPWAIVLPSPSEKSIHLNYSTARGTVAAASSAAFKEGF